MFDQVRLKPACFPTETSYSLVCVCVCVCVCIRVKSRFQQFFSHITTVSGCDKELNAHFYGAASLKYHVPDT